MTQEIVLTVGLPASGKTTWADELVAQDPNYFNINRDDIRLALQGRKRYNKFSKAREKIVTDAAEAAARSAIANGKSVIISDTNLNRARNQRWIDMAGANNIQYRQKLFTDVPLGELLRRDARREFPVGQRVIERMRNANPEWFQFKPEYDPALPNAYLCDIDGTLARMVSRGPFEWMKVNEDVPKQDVMNVVNALKAAGNTLLILSGRDGVCREMTEKWLEQHGVVYDEFWIRPAGDNRKDYDIKQEIYENEIRGKYNVMGVFDDRDQVVTLWRELGFTCFQVDYGDF